MPEDALPAEAPTSNASEARASTGSTSARGRRSAGRLYWIFVGLSIPYAMKQSQGGWISGMILALTFGGVLWMLVWPAWWWVGRPAIAPRVAQVRPLTVGLAWVAASGVVGWCLSGPDATSAARSVLEWLAILLIVGVPTATLRWYLLRESRSTQIGHTPAESEGSAGGSE